MNTPIILSLFLLFVSLFALAVYHILKALERISKTLDHIVLHAQEITKCTGSRTAGSEQYRTDGNALIVRIRGER